MSYGDKDRDYAFPDPASNAQYGLTKREYFAAMAMQALIARGTDGRDEYFAARARDYADALIAALNAEPQQ